MATRAWPGAENTPPHGPAKPPYTPHDSAMSVSNHDNDKIVRDLQQEVRDLAERVSGASLQFVNYENEIRVLQAQLRQEKRKNTAPAAINTAVPPPTPTTARPQLPPSISRFGSFIGTRKAAATPTPLSPERERELESALVQEQTRRLAAEKKAAEVTGEIEELSTTLFQQANDMVSAERKENAALKERIRLLEEKEVKVTRRLEALEQRDVERKRRMDRIEGAIKRIERAKTLLMPR